uniref:Uncharacterized protein n=1 Tax=Solanum lycopersicum TaxID=4081 RepID=A0A3Q7F9U4_SOLLC
MGNFMFSDLINVLRINRCGLLRIWQVVVQKVNFKMDDNGSGVSRDGQGEKDMMFFCLLFCSFARNEDDLLCTRACPSLFLLLSSGFGCHLSSLNKLNASDGSYKLSGYISDICYINLLGALISLGDDDIQLLLIFEIRVERWLILLGVSHLGLFPVKHEAAVTYDFGNIERNLLVPAINNLEKEDCKVLLNSIMMEMI